MPVRSRAALALWVAACGSAGGEPPCLPTAAGFGAVCASFIKCPEDAPICVTETHDETWGYCTRVCVDLFDCVTDAGVTACRADITDVPDAGGTVRGCAFDCTAGECPAGFECRASIGMCFPIQATAWPDAALRCEP